MLKDIVEKSGYTVYKLSKDAGIPYSTLSDLVSGKTDIKKISSELLYKLSKQLDVSMERLYLSDEERKMYIYNEGRKIVIEYDGERYSYLGPKNLIGFKEVREVSDLKMIHVDTWFRDEDDTIYLEEDYIDLIDVFADYGLDAPEIALQDIVLGTPKDKTKEILAASSILVSDYMAIMPAESSTENENVLVINITRPANRMLVRLTDYAVLFSNMKPDMERRGIESVKRNIQLIKESIRERRKYA